jgi:hypothetical protein
MFNNVANRQLPITNCKLIFLLVLVLAAGSCTYISTKKSKVDLAVDPQVMIDSLRTLISGQDVQICRLEKTVGDKVTVQCEIRITNPTNLPADLNLQEELAHRIAKQIRSELKDPGSFRVFNVWFDNVSGIPGFKTHNSRCYTFGFD